MDLDGEIDRRKALKSRKGSKGHSLVLFAVDRHDVFAPPPQEFIHTEILNVSSIRDVEPRRMFAHRSEHLLKQKPKARRAAEEPCALSRIPYPIAETNVEQRKPES